MRCTALLAGIALAGCTQSSTSYPSLLPRPIETQSVTEPEPAAAATPSPDAALDASIAQIRAAAAENGRRFTTAAQTAEAKVALSRGLKPGSDAWLAAQVALGELDTLRAPTLTALEELEQLAIERGAAGQGTYPTLENAAREMETLAKVQADRIAALDAALGES